MEQETLNAINNTLTTMQNVGFGIVLAFVIVMMVFAYILDRRSRSKTEDYDSKQNEQVLLLLAKAIDTKDTETAKAIAGTQDILKQMSEIVSITKQSLDQNTLAFNSNRDYRAESLTALKEVAILSSKGNDQLAALRIDVSAWPKEVISSVGVLEKNLEKALLEMKHDIVASILGIPPDSALARYFQDILAKLDQILVSVNTPPALPPATPALVNDDKELGYKLALEAKRATDQVKKVESPPDNTGDRPGDAA
jgi:hypothetical protein